MPVTGRHCGCQGHTGEDPGVEMYNIGLEDGELEFHVHAGKRGGAGDRDGTRSRGRGARLRSSDPSLGQWGAMEGL